MTYLLLEFRCYVVYKMRERHFRLVAAILVFQLPVTSDIDLSVTIVTPNPENMVIAFRMSVLCCLEAEIKDFRLVAAILVFQLPVANVEHCS